MIPILYNGTESEFLTNGIGRLTDCISCVVTEERNGIYECEFEYPVTGAHFADIKEGRIIAVTHDENGDVQPFDIYKRSAEIDGKVTFSARHISYRLGWTVVMPFTATSCSQALSRIPQYAHGGTPFTFWTDKAVSADYSLKAPEVIRGMLGGQEGSILDVFGTGEYEWDRFAVKLWLHRGEEKPVTIRYGKDMTDMTQDLDFGESYTSVIPIWVSPDGSSAVIGNQVNGGTALTDVGPWWYDSQRLPLMADTDEELWFEAPIVRTTILDLSSEFATRPTVAELTEKALSSVQSNKPWEPKENIEVDFVRLYNSPEYANYAPLQQVRLCDTVTVLYSELGIEVSAKIIRVEYNVLLECYDKMVLGDPETSFADIIHAETVEEIAKTAATKAYANSAAQAQADLIAGGLGGYAIIGRDADGRPNEFIVMDTDDKETAVNVIRINNNGIAFSTSGYEGPFTTAWTIDGSFSANFIKAGRISSADGTTYFDLATAVVRTYSAASNRIARLQQGGVNFGYLDSNNVEQLAAAISEMKFRVPSIIDGSPTLIDDPDCLWIGANTAVLLGYFGATDGNTYNTYWRVLVGKDGVVIGTTTPIYFHDGTLNRIATIRVRADSNNYFRLYTNNVDYWWQNSVDATSANANWGLTIRSIYVTGAVSAGSVINRSDERLKSIKAWDAKYDKLIDRLTPILYEWRNSRTDNRTHLGLGAQTVEKELKRLGIENSAIVKQEDDGEYSLNYIELSVLLMKKVQDQQKQIDAQQAQIDGLTARLEALERRLSE